MSKQSKSTRNALRPEYDLAKLKGGVRGKYFKRAKAGSNLMLLDSDVAKVFPDAKSVNKALRVIVELVEQSK